MDIDVSTCGKISPLNALNYLIESFDSDVITIDYRVRGFTRDIYGEKHFIDHDISSIQDFISQDILDKYHLIDMNIYQSNIFHTKMRINELNLTKYLFDTKNGNVSNKEKTDILNKLEREINEIFYGINIK